MADALTLVSGRVLPATVQRLDQIAQALAARRPGESVKRADAMRVALERGIEALERELGIEDDAASEKSLSAVQKGAKTPRKAK